LTETLVTAEPDPAAFVAVTDIGSVDVCIGCRGPRETVCCSITPVDGYP